MLGIIFIPFVEANGRARDKRQLSTNWLSTKIQAKRVLHDKKCHRGLTIDRSVYKLHPDSTERESRLEIPRRDYCKSRVRGLIVIQRR
jgi:hypothetical protein